MKPSFKVHVTPRLIHIESFIVKIMQHNSCFIMSVTRPRTHWTAYGTSDTNARKSHILKYKRHRQIHIEATSYSISDTELKLIFYRSGHKPIIKVGKVVKVRSYEGRQGWNLSFEPNLWRSEIAAWSPFLRYCGIFILRFCGILSWDTVAFLRPRVGKIHDPYTAFRARFYVRPTT